MRRRTATLAAIAATTVVGALVAVQAWQTEYAAARRIGVILATVDSAIVIDQVAPGLPAERAGFETGDVVVRIDGEAVATPADWDPVAAGFRRAEPTEFVVQRDGSETTLIVRPGTPFPWTAFLLNLAATLGYLGVGIIALLQNLADRRARLLFAFSAAVAFELALPVQLDLVPAWPLVNAVLFYLVSGTQMGLELHLASVIPRRFDWFTSRRWLPGLYYAIGLGLGVVTSATVLGEALGVRLFPWDAAGAALFLDQYGLTAWAIAVVVILVAQIRHTDNHRHHAQGLLVLFGVAPWAVLTVVVELAVAYQFQIPDWYAPAESIVLLAYPVAVFFAIFRYSLFDIELVLKRSLVFTLVTAAMAFVFWGAFSIGNAVFVRQAAAGGLSVGALSLSMLALGLLFFPVRRAVQRAVDRRLFPERLAMRHRLAELAAELPTHGNLSAMGRHVVTQVCEVFGFASATLLVADPASGVLVTLASTTVDPERQFGESFLIERDDPGVVLLGRAGRPLPAHEVAVRSAALAQRLHAFGATLALGLTSGASLVGVLLLGPKPTEDRLRSEESELLSLFSHMVATVLENVRLFESATFESLTGLLRREAILSALELELHRAHRYGRPLAVGMADIDHFKRVNDVYGHLAGDALLKQVAQTLKNGLRGSDAIGRYGGEEFLFFLPETEIDGAVRVAEKLRRLVEEMPNPIEGADAVKVTISIGLAELATDPGTEVTVSSLIADADANLLDAKREGRNRVIPGPRAVA